MGEVERECLWGWCEQEFVIKKKKGRWKKVFVGGEHDQGVGTVSGERNDTGIARAQKDGWEKGVTKANGRPNEFVSRNKIFVLRNKYFVFRYLIFIEKWGRWKESVCGEK